MDNLNKSKNCIMFGYTLPVFLVLLVAILSQSVVGADLISQDTIYVQPGETLVEEKRIVAVKN